MAIHSKNRFASIGNVNVEAAEGFEGTIGVQLAMIEGYQDDMAIFDESIRSDFDGQFSLLEGASEEEVSAIEEGALGDIWARIKEFFTKLLARIKAIFKGFMAKFDSQVMKSNKEFFDKYKSIVYAKDFGKMKIKYSKPKHVNDILFVYNGGGAAKTNEMCLNMHTLTAGSVDIDKLVEDFDREEYICNVLNKCEPKTNISSVKEYEKEFHEKCSEDEEEVDGCNSLLTEVAALLSLKKNPIDIAKKTNASLEKAISEMIRQIEKDKDNVIKYIVPDSKETGDFSTSGSYRSNRSDSTGKYDKDSKSGSFNAGTSDDKKAAQKAINYIHTQATAIQEASGKFTAACLREVKFEVAQARRVYAAMVAFNPKSVKEDALLMQIAQEAAEYEVLSNLD